MLLSPEPALRLSFSRLQTRSTRRRQAVLHKTTRVKETWTNLCHLTHSTIHRYARNKIAETSMRMGWNLWRPCSRQLPATIIRAIKICPTRVPERMKNLKLTCMRALLMGTASPSQSSTTVSIKRCKTKARLSHLAMHSSLLTTPMMMISFCPSSVDHGEKNGFTMDATTIGSASGLHHRRLASRWLLRGPLRQANKCRRRSEGHSVDVRVLRRNR